jgi:hypothetical protein
MTLDKMIEVLQAAKDGKEIEFKEKNKSYWQRLYYKEEEGGLAAWNFWEYDYRIKPKPREIWVNKYSSHWLAHPTKESAILHSGGTLEPVLFREVIDE